MQKVEGSSPFIRLRESSGNGGFSFPRCPLESAPETVSQLLVRLQGARDGQGHVPKRHLVNLGTTWTCSGCRSGDVAKQKGNELPSAVRRRRSAKRCTTLATEAGVARGVLSAACAGSHQSRIRRTRAVRPRARARSTSACSRRQSSVAPAQPHAVLASDACEAEWTAAPHALGESD
jgi:hypothetical protein